MSVARVVLHVVMASITVGVSAQEVYYDQFDWGGPGNPGGLNTAFWSGNRERFRYEPDRSIAPTVGSASLGNGDVFYSVVGSRELGGALPGGDYEFYARVRLSDFADTAGERNAEIAFRSNNGNGYLFTVDGGQDLIRLRRQGSDFRDLTEPASHAIAPGDVFYLNVQVTGSGPVNIRARAATDPSFTGEALLFDATVAETNWVQNGPRIDLIGFCNQGTYTFDFDYFAVGTPGFSHPESAWERIHHTGAGPEPASVEIGNLDRIDVTQRSVVLHSGPAALQVMPIHPGVVRVDFRPDSRTTTTTLESFAVLPTQTAVPFQVVQEDVIRIEGEGFRVDVERTPLRLVFRRPDGTLLIRESAAAPTRANGDSRSIAFDVQAQDDFYGMGQHSIRDSGLSINRRGAVIDTRNRHQPPSVLFFPFWVSRLGYGLFIDNPAFATLNMAQNPTDRVTYSSERGELTYFVFFGDSMADALDGYTRTTGRPSLAPRWSLGNWQSKYGYESFDEIDTIADGFDTRAIPLDGIIIDLFWFGRETMGNLDFQNTTNWANPATRLADLRSRGIRTIPITEPQVTGLSFNASELLAEGLVGTRADRTSPYGFSLGWITNQASIYLLDFTNPRTRTWFRDRHERLLVDYGFAGFWQDLNEPEGQPDEMWYAAGPAQAVGNVISLGMNRAGAEAFDEFRPGSRPFLMSRSGYAGMQRYGTSVWSGDVDSSWNDLARQPALATSMGLAGVPYWNSDIGGFNGTPSQELYIRWCQFGAFNPMYRPHGAFSDREPWRFGTRAVTEIRNLLRLRYSLIPYFYTASRVAYDTGTPMMRPLVMEWPGDAQVHDLGSQFLYGDSLLLRPVVQQGVSEVSVYLPAGSWRDFFSNDQLEGPVWVNRPAANFAFPLLVRQPAIIPTVPPALRTDSIGRSRIELNVFLPDGPAQASGSLYEDDGETLAYQTGHHAWTHFRARRTDAGLRVEIDPATGMFANALGTRDFDVRIPDASEPIRVLFDGVEAPRAATQDAYDNGTGPRWYWTASPAALRLRTSETQATNARVIEAIAPAAGDTWRVE